MAGCGLVDQGQDAMIIIRSKADSADTYLFDDARDAIAFMADKARKDWAVFVASEYDGRMTEKALCAILPNALPTGQE